MKTYLTKTCKFCNTQFQTKNVETDFCCHRHKKQYLNKLNPKPKKDPNTKQKYSYICTHCQKPFETIKPGTRMCSQQCRIDSHVAKKREEKREQNNKLYENVADIPTCKICGWKSRHLISHLRCHDISVDEYRQQYNATDADLFHSSYMQHLSDKMVGDKNPGFQHGGTMSSFSKKFRKYENLTEEEKEKEIQAKFMKASLTKRANNSYTTTIEYYTTRGYTEEEAAVRLSERQRTFSLQKCIEKHGEEKGKEMWLARQSKWLDAIAKSLKCGYSKISQELFKSVESEIPYKCFFATNGEPNRNNEYKLQTTESYVKLDFFVPGKNKIIEFDGDYWHSERNPNNLCTHRRDASIMDKYPEMQILHVYERDYKKDKLGTIRKCIDFLRT